MPSLATDFAILGIATTAIIYGTDLFCALVVKPAAERATEASVADLMGWVHEFGDRRLPIPGVASILASGIVLAFARSTTPRVAAGAALLALLSWLALYLGVSAPINRRLRAATHDHTVPADTRALQRRWDSVIWPRALLQTVALAGLVVAALSA